MISRSLSRKSIVALITFSVLSVYSMVVLAAPGATAFGELSAYGEVTINGEKGILGSTIFTDSAIATGAHSNASVSVGKAGRVGVAADSDLRLSFTSNSFTANLATGGAQVSAAKRTTVNLTTENSTVVVDGTQATTFTISTSPGSTRLTVLSGVAQFSADGSVKDVSAGESATAGTPPPTPPNNHGVSSGALAALLLAVGAAVAAAILATSHNNDFNFGGTPIIISPTR